MDSNPNGWLEDISNNLDYIRQELRIANQLKFLRMTRYMAWAIGHADGVSEEETRVYIDLRDKLAPIKEKA